jgi:hypothetical protein
MPKVPQVMFVHFPFYLAMIVAIVLLTILAEKIRVAYPVILVLPGLLISSFRVSRYCISRLNLSSLFFCPHYYTAQEKIEILFPK